MTFRICWQAAYCCEIVETTNRSALQKWGIDIRSNNPSSIQHQQWTTSRQEFNVIWHQHHQCSTTVSRMTYNVLVETLNPTHSLTHQCYSVQFISSAQQICDNCLNMRLHFTALGFWQEHCRTLNKLYFPANRALGVILMLLFVGVVLVLVLLLVASVLVLVLVLVLELTVLETSLVSSAYWCCWILNDWTMLETGEV